MRAVYWFQTGNGITRWKAPSTSSRDAPSLTTSVGVPTKPWSSPPHRSRAVSRDFVHWCFSYACRRRLRIGSSCRHPKSFTIAVEVVAVARFSASCQFLAHALQQTASTDPGWLVVTSARASSAGSTAAFHDARCGRSNVAAAEPSRYGDIELDLEPHVEAPAPPRSCCRTWW